MNKLEILRARLEEARWWNSAEYNMKVTMTDMDMRIAQMERELADLTPTTDATRERLLGEGISWASSE